MDDTASSSRLTTEFPEDQSILGLYRTILLNLYALAEKDQTLLLPMSSEDLEGSKGIDAKKQPLRFARALHMITESAMAISKGQFTNIRGLYYTAPSLYGTQTQSNALIAEFCLGYSVERESMHYRVTAKGLLLGNCTIVTRMGTITTSTLVATPITPHFFYLQQIHTDAQFVLVVEKDTVFEHFIDGYSTLQDMLGCHFMIITGKGYPDMATRALISFLHTCGIRIFGLADGDAHGMNILCIYAYGSESKSKRVVVPRTYTAPSLVPIGVFSRHVRVRLGDTDRVDSAVTARGSHSYSGADAKLYEKLIARLSTLGRTEWVSEIKQLAALGTQYEIETIFEHDESYVAYIAELLRAQNIYCRFK